ncbi:MAG: pseudomonalisin [Actinomycetota bacterium]|nr:pseudomonalisin [Actinomycetota bacterium]
MERVRKRSWHERTACVLAAVGIAALLGSGHQALAGSGSTVRLTRDVVRNLNLATPLGPVPATQPITVGVFLSSPNQAAEDAYVKQLSDPASPNFQNFLDPDAFNQQFGVPAATVQAATAWLQGAGLQVTPVDGSTDYLLASGSAAQVGAAFSTTFSRYTAAGKTFYANTLAPAVPASLGVGTVLGLNDFNRFLTPRVSAPAGKQTTVAAPSANAVPNTGLLSPQDLWSIYDLPSTNLGNGQAMAIFGWGVTDPVIPDLRSFETEWGLPQVPVTVRFYGDTSTPDTSGDGATGEWELDTQASTGMAPNVTSESLYFGHHNTDADILAALTAWVNDKKGPLQGSASFGECENVGNAGAVLADGLEVPGDKVLEQAVAEGRTLFASTGDTGSSCPIAPVNTNGLATQGYPGLEWPSVSPWVVAVGGTDLTSDGTNPPHRLAETAWEFTGGGNSTSEPAGSYQTGVAPTNCAFDADGNPYVPGVTAASPVCRSTPDVAAISGDVATGNGMLITNDSGADQQGAGTSLSSPLWLGMWTRIQAAQGNKGLGFANYPLYKVAKASPGRDFFDVTVGDNQPYPAKPGYDNTTGWGTPEVAQLMLDLTGRLTPARNVAPAPTAATPTTTCGPLFSDPSGDDSYAIEGQTLAAQGTSPQLDILGGQILLSADGQTLRTIITVRNLSTTIPTGGVENDYNLVWTFGGTQYFTQLAIEPNGAVQAYDGQLVHVSLENRYQQLHIDAGKITLGANGVVEVDVPLANLPGVATAARFQHPSAAAYVREGVLAGTLEPLDAAGPLNDYVVGGC